MKLLYIVWCAAFVSSNALNLTDSSSKAVKNRTSRKLGRSKLVTNIIPKTLEAEEDNVLLDQWKQIEQNAQSFTTSLVFESFLPTLERLFEGNNVSLQCQKSIYRVLADATKLKKYAIQSKYIWISNFKINISIIFEHFNIQINAYQLVVLCKRSVLMNFLRKLSLTLAFKLRKNQTQRVDVDNLLITRKRS